MRRTLAIALCILPFLGFSLAHRVVAVTHGQAADPFWSVVRKGMEVAARHTGIEVEYYAPETFDLKRMGQLIDQAVASEPDGLVVSIPDARVLGPHIQAAVATEIPVISINSGGDAFKQLGVLMHVGQVEYIAGREGGERMRALGVRHAVCVNHETGNVALDQRCQGFRDWLGPEARVEVLSVPLEPGAIRKAVLDYLRTHAETEGVLTLGPAGAEPTLQALEESGKTGTVVFATFDLSPTILRALIARKMAFAIDQQQYLQGYLPIVFLANYVRYGLLPANDVVLTGPSFVTPENAARILELTRKDIW